MSRKTVDTSLPPSVDETFLALKTSLQDAIKKSDSPAIIMSVMQLGAHANSTEADWKMSPRTFFEFSDVLRQMKNDGQITDSGQAQILELIRGQK